MFAQIETFAKLRQSEAGRAKLGRLMRAIAARFVPIVQRRKAAASQIAQV